MDIFGYTLVKTNELKYLRRVRDLETETIIKHVPIEPDQIEFIPENAKGIIIHYDGHFDEEVIRELMERLKDRYNLPVTVLGRNASIVVVTYGR